MRKSDRYRYLIILAILVLLQFTLRGRLGDERVAPDFLLLALLIYTIRAQPGRSAAAGFVVGLLRDALTPSSFGAGALAHTIVGYLSSWAKAVFFAENVFVNGCIFFAGTWLRNLAVLLASGGFERAQLAWELLVWSPLQSLTTATVGVLVLWLFGRWVTARVPGAGGGGGGGGAKVHTFHPHLLDRRLRAVRLLVWAVLAIMVFAFFRTQILGHGKYQLQSETNRLRPIPLPAPRGLIFDRNGRVLAENVPGYTVSLLPGPEANLRTTLRAIARVARLDAASVERVIQRARRAPYQPALVLPDASFGVVSALEERRFEIPGLLIQSAPRRHYPDSSVIAHLVGFIGEVTEGERATTRFSGVRLGGLVGKDGLEREYDDSLRGADGVRFVEVSALGHMVGEAGASATLPAVSGLALHTTVDLELQRYIARSFPAGKRGAVVALNPNTGEILALYSAPGFDPNAFVGGVSPEYWRALNENPARPLLDRVIQARYPPGSTWKLGVATWGLRRGLVTFRSRMPIPCRGGMQYGNRYFRCWHAGGHGDLNLSEAIANSCDVYFYQLGIKLGVSAMLEDGVGTGFRGRTGIDLPGEIPSEYPTGPEYYDRLYGPRRWTSAVALNLAIGQGENAQTLINMVRLYQMLAADGRARTPFIVRSASRGSGAGGSLALDLTPEQLAGLRRAMIAVVEEGTARGSRLQSLTIAGKTATSQNPHGADHGWFIGFGPADKPEIVVGAVVEFAEHGSAIAPLVSRTIAHYLGLDESAAAGMRVIVPNDSAPPPFILPILPLPPTESLRLRPIPFPTDTVRAVPPPPDR